MYLITDFISFIGYLQFIIVIIMVTMVVLIISANFKWSRVLIVKTSTDIESWFLSRTVHIRESHFQTTFFYLIRFEKGTYSCKLRVLLGIPIHSYVYIKYLPLWLRVVSILQCISGENSNSPTERFFIPTTRSSVSSDWELTIRNDEKIVTSFEILNKWRVRWLI